MNMISITTNRFSLRGFDEKFWMPHSRHTTVSLEQIKAHRELELLAGSEPTGAAIVRSVR